LQSQLNALCNCKIRSSGGDVISILLRSYMMIIKDSIILYTMLHDSMIQLVELFWKIEKTKASKILSMYKLYVRETNVLISIYNKVRNFFKELPNLKAADESMIVSMEKYVANLDDDEGNKEKEEPISEDIPEELISTTPGSTFQSTGSNQLGNFQSEQNSESEESSGGEDVDHETDEFFKSIITDFPSESFGQPQPQDDPFSIFKPTSVPYSTATYEERINFIKSIPQTSISMTTQSLQTPNPFQTMQPQTTNVNPFSDLVNPFANIITSNTMTNDQSNPFSTRTQGNPFI